MKIGTAVRMPSCAISETFDGGTASLKYCAPKGQLFVFLLLGTEPKDGSAPLNARGLLEDWGWCSPSEDRVQPQSEAEALQAAGRAAAKIGIQLTLMELKTILQALYGKGFERPELPCADPKVVQHDTPLSGGGEP